MKLLQLCSGVVALASVVTSGVSFADDPASDQLGTIHFAVSGKPAAQEHVIRGVKLVHHMMYPEADHEFAAAAAADPTCALAYWGRAMTLIHPLWPDAPSDADRKLGAQQIQLGLACPPATARERAYLEALGRYFGDGAPGDYVAGLKTLDEAWGEVADRYTEDLDAASFAALYHLAPARFLPKDKSLRLQLTAFARLQKVLAQIPDHPGAQHYKIHACDFPLLADRALEVCDTYGGIAPDVPHALHMPTHIYTRRGLWDKSIEYNLRSAEAARKLAESARSMNSHYPHALDYLAYAYLQRGQYAEANAIRQKVSALSGPYSPSSMTPIGFALAAIPARCVLERQAWSEAAALPMRQPSGFPWGKQFLNCDSITHFARALGAARSGQLDMARAEIAELERLQQKLSTTKGPAYWVAQAETQVLTARAWVAFATKNTDEAIALLQRAADLESKTDKEAVTPGEVLPAGDSLGDMLLEAGRPAEALAAFEAVLVASPNRLNTLYGVGRAAELAGDTAKARSYFEQLTKVASKSDAGITRVEHARAFLGGARLTLSK